jgi:hypothetical protein
VGLCEKTFLTPDATKKYFEGGLFFDFAAQNQKKVLLRY